MTSVVSRVRDLSEYDYQTVLNNWSVKREQGKADFLELLYDFYKPSNHCYTGLYERFAFDLIETYRDCFIDGTLDLKVLITDDDSESFNHSGEPICDVQPSFARSYKLV